MDDLISRQAAIVALEREKTYCTAYKDGYTQTDVFKQYNMGLTDGIKALKSLPSAQETGTWLVAEGACEPDYMECSKCGWITEYYGGLEEEWNYCPHCGARMERE